MSGEPPTAHDEAKPSATLQARRDLVIGRRRARPQHRRGHRESGNQRDRAPENWLSRAYRAIEQRRDICDVPCPSSDCLRLVDNEVVGLVIDKFGPCLWIHWSLSIPLAQIDRQHFNDLTVAAGAHHWLVNRRIDRGRDPLTTHRVLSDRFPLNWIVTENSLLFELRRDQGLSPGLFLDQRLNRNRARLVAPGARVLNLFSYTCAFSVAAAAGGAQSVVSVDLSKAFIEWGRRNMALNDHDTPNHTYWVGDAREFLRMAEKKERKFDLIIVDPPSFSRGAKRRFAIRQDLFKIVQVCASLLSIGGRIFISSNMQTWPMGGFLDTIHKAVGADPETPFKPALAPPDFCDPKTRLRAVWVEKTDSGHFIQRFGRDPKPGHSI